MPVIAAGVCGGSLYQGDAPIASAEALQYQLVLGLEVVIETALGDIQFRGDLFDRGAAIAALIDEEGRGACEIARHAFDADLQLGLVDLQQVRMPARLLRRDTVFEDLDEAMGDAVVIPGRILRQPGRQPEHVLDQDMGADRGENLLFCRARDVEKGAQLAEDGNIALRQIGIIGLVQGPDVGQDRDRTFLVRIDAGLQGEILADIMGNARLRRGLRGGLGDQRLDPLERTFEDRRGQQFLALEVIGNAGCVEIDELRDVDEGHPPHAVPVDQGRGGVEDHFAFLFETSCFCAHSAVFGAIHSIRLAEFVRIVT